MAIKGSTVKPIKPMLALFIIAVPLIAANLQGVQAQEELSVTVYVSNNDGHVQVTGIVEDLDQNPVQGAEVSIQVDDPSGKTLHLELAYTDQNGEFADSFMSPEEVNGECTVSVSASKAGYMNGNAMTTFTAIPEFTMITAFIISMILVCLMLKSRRQFSRKI